MASRAVVSSVGVICALAGVVLGLGVGKRGEARQVPIRPTAQTTLAAEGCYHYEGSVWYCPDTSYVARAATDRLSIVITSHGGAQRTFQVPEKVDAIFFSVEAVDKFVLPWYARTQGKAAAAKIRESAVKKLSPR